MKSLYVMRHAKSSWDHPHLSDFERPLNKRGEQAAPLMGGFMRSEGLVPDLILSSPAVRARMTSELAAEAGGFDAEIRFDERIYGAGANSLIFIVSGVEDEVAALMIVGHNPGFEYLVHVLCGENRRMPTAALAVIDLDAEKWNDIGEGSGELREIYYPKELKNG